MFVWQGYLPIRKPWGLDFQNPISKTIWILYQNSKLFLYLAWASKMVMTLTQLSIKHQQNNLIAINIVPDNMWNSWDSYILPSQYLASCDNDKNPTFTRIRNFPTKLSSIPVMNGHLKIIRTLTKVIWVKVSKYHAIQILFKREASVAIGIYWPNHNPL